MQSQQRGATRPRTRGTERSSKRRAELIAIGRKLFADTSYDALSMDDIAQHAGVAKGLIYYYFKSKRGYYLEIVQDSVAELVDGASGHTELSGAERAHRTIDGYLRYAEQHQAAYRTIISGGVGFDTEVLAIRDGVREAMIGTLAEGAYGHRSVPAIARLALLGWLCSVEGVTLDWIGHQKEQRSSVRRLLVRTLRGTLDAIEEFEPSCPSPPREARELERAPAFAGHPGHAEHAVHAEHAEHAGHTDGGGSPQAPAPE